MAIMLAKTYAAFKGNRLTAIETDIKLIKETMATKAWVLGQTIVLLGGMAALLKILH